MLQQQPDPKLAISAPRRRPAAESLSRRQFLTLTAALGAATLAACAPAAAPTPAPAPATTAPAEAAAPASTAATSTLRAAWEIPVQLDPAFASSDSEIAILNAVYDYLIDVDAGSNIQPRLAASWSVSDDGLTYVFDLVPGVTFHDGSPLTAADVVWTFDRLRDPGQDLPTKDLYANVDSMQAPDELTVVFQLKQTNPFFLFDLSDNHALVVQTDATAFSTTFNGTGPFKVSSYSPEDRMEFTANSDYFMAGKPGVDGMVFIFFSDQNAKVDALRGGQLDLVLRMPTPLYLSLQNEPNLTTLNIPTNGFDLVRLRSDREPGSDPRVIQAMKLATDRQAIFDTVTLGLGAVGRDSPIGPLFTTYYSEATPIPPRDAAAAKALLAEAGYADGLELDMHVPDSGDRPDLAVVLKEQWAEAGININVIVEPESVYYGDNGWLEVDLGITGWGSRPTPQFYLDVMLVSDAQWNESHFSDPEFDQLAALAGSTLDENERIAAYGQIQAILIERGPIIIPYFFAQLGAIRNDFTDLRMKAFPGRTDLAAVRPAV